MPCILNIETATDVCSVAISKDGQTIFGKEEMKGPSHAALLGIFADEAVKAVRSENLKLDAVAVSCGPGSYTGLRIGVSEAKGLCYGMNIPLIAINSLKIMANGILKRSDTGAYDLLCPMIDARRMEVYDVLLDKRLQEMRPVNADIIDAGSFAGYFEKSSILFFGSGAAKCKGVFRSKRALFIDNVYPQATDMINLSEKAFANKDFVNIAYFEPFYLKEFVATTPKNKVLNSES
jgi:tRNA threonylcarbamoyladenosine biosynthesis protein TsaB